VSAPSFRTGLAALLAGVLYFAGHVGELAFDTLFGGEAVFAALGIAGIVALGVAFWGLREVVSGTRRGRVGIRLALAGFALLVLFAVQVAVEQLRSGDFPDNWVLFALGLLLVTVGQLLFARDLRATVGRAWVVPLVAVAGLIVALTAGGAIHDLGLVVFEAAWVVLGVALLRAARTPAPALAPRSSAS
jgi:hypothetical protein